MKYKIIATKHFQKDVKRCKKRNLPMDKLKKVILLLEEFGKLPSELNDYEATMLAGVPNAPSVYAPTVNFKLASERQVQVLNKMVKYNYITEEERKEILSQTDYYEDYFNKK